jgi:hypothetical protein
VSEGEIELERFARVLDAYGADAGRWPEAERAAALRLVARSAEARALRDHAAELDALLERAPLAEPSPGLRATVLADVLATVLTSASPAPWRQWAALLWPFGPSWQPASALLLAGLLGFAVGAAMPPTAGAALDAATSEIDGLVLGTTMDYGIER